MEEVEDKKEFRSGSSASSLDSDSQHQHDSNRHHQLEQNSSKTNSHVIDSKVEEGSPSKERYQPPVQYVPRHLRRGLLGRFTLIPETPTPTQYPNRTKWMITAIVALAAAAAPMGSASILPALTLVTADFHTTNTITNLSVALYMLAMSIFPLWWSSFSEQFGRRSIYMASFTMFIVFAILSAEARSIAMLIVMRLLSGGAAASVQAVGAGTIADIWEPRERGRAMGIFYLGPLMGPLLTPIIGGALANAFGWRATQWFLVIFGGVVLVGLTVLLPETLTRRKSALEAVPEEKKATVVGEAALAGVSKDPAPNAETRAVVGTENSMPSLQRTTTRQSIRNQSKRSAVFLKRCIIDPLKIILLLRYPAVAITVYYAAITFGSLYTLNVSIELSFSRAPYNFSTLIIGLLYIPNSIGYVLASIFGGRWLDHIMKREARKKGRIDADGNLILRPEDRMKENAWLAAFIYPLALIWYGWAVEKGTHWIVPMIANFFFGVGSMIIFAMATTMLTEFMPRKASTGIAVNNFVRNVFSCVGGLVAAPIIDAIGNGWLFTILGAVSLVSGAGVIMAMKTYSERWRVEMDRRMKD